ncbi:MAG: adenylyl-sulfate kinase [Gammaproteobacteria bacterium]|nr:adenylyl-sulfate kinase [Gammaproteobacteria bacterium]
MKPLTVCSTNFDQELSSVSLRFIVEDIISSPDENRSEVLGYIASGFINTGDSVISSITGKQSIVENITKSEKPVDTIGLGDKATISLLGNAGIRMGDVLAAAGMECEFSDQIAANILWSGKEELLPERTYTARFISMEVDVQVTDIVYRSAPDSSEQLAAKTLSLSQSGYCKLALDSAVLFDAYSDNSSTGVFELKDKFTEHILGVGKIDFALRRASNIGWHAMKIDKAFRARLNHQKPCVLWFTGFSGSGKSTIADQVEQKLGAAGKRTYLLDGDNVRHGLNKDLGFTDEGRVENIRRIAEVSRLMVDVGLIVITSFISPFRAERQMARELMEKDEFIEVFVDTPIDVCEHRDPKGLYKKARRGELANFTGIDSEYEPPNSAEITLLGDGDSADTLADQVIDYLDQI